MGMILGDEIGKLLVENVFVSVAATMLIVVRVFCMFLCDSVSLHHLLNLFILTILDLIS